jgi:hypothetical protein
MNYKPKTDRHAHRNFLDAKAEMEKLYGTPNQEQSNIQTPEPLKDNLLYQTPAEKTRSTSFKELEPAMLDPVAEHILAMTKEWASSEQVREELTNYSKESRYEKEFAL